MRYAIFSDIHNDTSALISMLKHAAVQQVDAYLCLGDIGIDACLALVRGVNADAVFGNWEVSGWRNLSPHNQKWVLGLPPMRKYDDFWISHATPGWPDSIENLAQYQKARHRLGTQRVFPYYLSISDSLWQAFADLLAGHMPIFFHGHTHRQMVWAFNNNNKISQKAATSFIINPDETYIIGVGSVGQPKDSTKPGYAIFDSEAKSVEFLRLTETL